MKIQLKEWEVKELSFHIAKEEKNHDNDKNSFNLKIADFYPEEDSIYFYIEFKIKINDTRFDLEFEIVFTFTTDSPITTEFKKSNFPKVNAPAIAFPFVRSYISNFTLQSGFDPIILPSVNFVELNKNQEA